MAPDDIDDFLDSPIDDFLVGLAHGIQRAQRELNQLTVPGQPGQPAVAYHLPRVEFELKMALALRGGAPRGAAPTSRAKMMFRPLRGGGDSYEAEAASVIRGSFVAVPLAGGRPPPVLSCTLEGGGREVAVVVTAADALGAPLADVEVEFNVDRERSLELGGAGAAPLKPETNVKSGVLRTGEGGRVENALLIAKAEPSGALVVLTVDALGASETVIVTVQ